jgi:DNA-directed RNA polymerase alpha subunit
VLEKSEVNKVEDILKLNESQLRTLEGMGDKGVKEIKKAIGDFGFNLKKEA